MKIRSITCLLKPDLSENSPLTKKTAEFVSSARQSFSSAGFEVQTTRLATPPFSIWLTGDDFVSLPERAKELEGILSTIGIDYLSLGPAFPERIEDYALIPQAIAATSNVNFAGSLTTRDGKVSLRAIKAAAEVICATAKISADGFANLRFAALANVQPGGAFFPAAYQHHLVEESQFTLATEAADLVVQAFDGAQSLEQARDRLVMVMEEKAEQLTAVAESVELESGFVFNGIDFTPAPFPRMAISVGNALEKLGLSELGQHGSLAAAAFLVDCLDRARFMRAGFNGLMLPVLEDAVLAQRGADGVLTVKDLLLYSTVCGTGLDTVPLPGDVSAGQIAAVLLDIATLAHRLDKPLTARLMPVPGLKAGDRVEYDFPYFASSRVLRLDTEPLIGLLDGDEEISIQPSPHHGGR